MGCSSSSFEVIPYGVHPDQFIRIYRPSSSEGKRPIAVIIHGGYWRQQYNVDNALIDSLPGFFANEGWWAVMIEYRRGNKEADGGDGGWPRTNQDMLLALNAVTKASTEERVRKLHYGITCHLTTALCYVLHTVFFHGFVSHGSAWSFCRYEPISSRFIVLFTIDNWCGSGGALALWTCTAGLDDAAASVPELRDIPIPRPALCVALSPVGNLVEGFVRRYSSLSFAIFCSL